MRLTEAESAAGLLADAQDFLSQREVENSRVLAILEALCQGQFAEPAPWLWCVREGASVRGVALRTPPLALHLSTMEPTACDAVASAVAGRGLLPLELIGSRAEVDGVLDGLSRRRAIVIDVINEMRQFELREVTPAPATPGLMRLASAAEASLIASLLDAFEREAVPHEVGRRDLRALAERMIARGAAFFWEDTGVCVALAAWQRRVGRGASIAPVYTPPELRSRGYATALVAALSQHMLDSGCEYTSLFTDLANPISNGIYPKVGYRVLCDARYVSVRPR
jgi:uncharacterized protein